MLEEYGKKRDFTRTPEPAPEPGRAPGPFIFVVHKHAARRLHYDLRLEVDGVLKSWAVPQGPSLDPRQKRLAVMVEDHPLDYAAFEGAIPEGEYGAGEVIVWDNGTYSPESGGKPFFHDPAEAAERMRRGLAAGKLSLVLRGKKLKGFWTLIKLKRGDKDWLLIKHQDSIADPEREILKEEQSVISGLTIDDLKAGRIPDPTHQSMLLKPQDLPGARLSPFPDSVAPMLATLTSAPFSHPEWLFEPKLDGVRIISFIDRGSIRLQSRRGLDDTRLYPSLVKDLSSQPVWQMLLDGEVVALDDAGRSCFQCLQPRLNLKRPEDISDAEAKIPVYYYVFDILYLDGYDLRGVPLYQRQELLSRVLLPGERIRLLEHFAEDGKTVYQAALDQGMEGVVAKRRDSVYESARRSPNWLKVKATTSDEFVIGGYTQGLGGRGGTFGSLLLGYYDNGSLIYAGKVGTGFDEAALTELRQRLDTLKTDACPFAEKPTLNAPTTWVRPETVAEVKFAQWTADGRLRAPSFLRLRDDKVATEVTHVKMAPAPAGSESVPDPAASLTKEIENILRLLANPGDSFTLPVQGHRLPVNNLSKELWPPRDGQAALTKRDLLMYLAKVAPYLLPHLRDRPLSLNRFPDGIYGEHFYQKHWDNPMPGFVDTVYLSEHKEGRREYILCNNLATLLWLGQLADMELHTWFSRVSPEPDGSYLKQAGITAADDITGYPDFIIFDIDPYIYSGQEAKGAEPELNRRAFARTAEVARRLKEVLDSLSLSAFVKTSGKTGLHVFVPVIRQFDYTTVRAAGETICRFLLQQHPEQITMEWAVEKRTGKVFLDYNQNVRGKTLAAIYSPRPTPEAAVSMPLRWDELDKVYPTDFTIVNVPARLAETGDLWAGILAAKHDLKALLEMRINRE